MDNKYNSLAKNHMIRKSSQMSIHGEIHPSWRRFIEYCKEELKYGELTRLQIQDGLPILAEHVRKKIKFI